MAAEDVPASGSKVVLLTSLKAGAARCRNSQQSTALPRVVKY